MNTFFLMTMFFILMYKIFSHPLFLVMILIAQTLPIMFLIMSSQDMSWLCLMLFLIFLGGLLVIFVYLSALIPNETSKKMNNSILMLLFLPLMMNQFNILKNYNMTTLNLSMFSSTNTSSTIPLMILYLLVALCVAMYLCKQMKTPLKQN